MNVSSYFDNKRFEEIHFHANENTRDNEFFYVAKNKEVVRENASEN